MAELRGGPYREQFVNLRAELAEIISNGHADPETFRTTLLRVLKSLETIRMKNDNDIIKKHQEIAHCTATSKAADTVANLLIGVIRGIKKDRSARKVPLIDKKDEDVLTDEELLQTICVCGCRDASDIATCKCPCHEGKSCGREHCVVCSAAEATRSATETVDDAVHRAPKNLENKFEQHDPGVEVGKTSKSSPARKEVSKNKPKKKVAKKTKKAVKAKK
jgi:hypothetical protein